jgi:hypothetical protein
MEMVHTRRAKRRRIIPPDQPTTAPAALEMFTCVKRGGLKLSTVGCGRLWFSANGTKPPDLHEGRAACRGCPIGESNHTGKPPDPYAALRESVRRICSRCGRITDRLINADTFGFCISCFNRHGEVLRGKNARGTVPTLSAQLHTEQAQVTTDAGSHILTRHLVLSFQELKIQAQRTAVVAMVFTRWITLGGCAESKNIAVGELGEVQPLAGSGTGANEAEARASSKRRPGTLRDQEPVTSWVRDARPVPVTSWMWNCPV